MHYQDYLSSVNLHLGSPGTMAICDSFFHFLWTYEKLVASTTGRYVRYEDMNQWTKHPLQVIEHLLKYVPMSVTVPACRCANVAVLMTASSLQLL